MRICIDSSGKGESLQSRLWRTSIQAQVAEMIHQSRRRAGIGFRMLYVSGPNSNK